MTYPVPTNEAERVTVVESYQITDTPPEISYDDLAELAAQICACPIGLVNIIADTKEWLKATGGCPTALPRLGDDHVHRLQRFYPPCGEGGAARADQ